MVYCGKASQGCQSCRTRRIKCDKLRPECSQCRRVEKKCPGYRDQLSLMFRDESSKVMQKAHAQWGMEPSEGGGAQPPPSSGSSNVASSSGPPSIASSSVGSPTGSTSPSSANSSPPAVAAAFSSSSLTMRGRRQVRNGTNNNPNQHQQQALARAASWPAPQRPAQIDPTWQDRGVQFFIDHYVLGLPDEADDAAGLRDQPWVFQDTLRQSMAAVGLAGVANLRDSKEIAAIARQLYGSALRDTGALLMRAQDQPLEFLIRNVLMLAMFEIVNGRNPNMSAGARTHMVGAAALLRSFFPVEAGGAAMGLRGLLQVCYALMLSFTVADIELPSTFHDWMTLSCKAMPDEERPSTELLPIVMQLITMSRDLRNRTLPDSPNGEAVDVLRSLNAAERQLEHWEDSINGIWAFRVASSPGLPRAAAFHGLYHVYENNWTARIWNYYRWARILACTMVIDVARDCPMAARVALGEETAVSAHRAAATRMAHDILVSVPTHWKHPFLTPAQRELVRCMGGAGTGSAGIPALLFHIQVAAAAPGVPSDYVSWALAVLDTVWADMGMVHARRLADSLRCQVALRETGGVPPRLGLAGRGGGAELKIEVA